MNYQTAQPRAAWGLDVGRSAAELVRLEHGPAGLRIENRRTFAVGELWRSGVLAADLADALASLPQHEPLGVCFPDQSMFYRGFSLPSTRPATLEKMVRAQVEGLLSAVGDRLAWTWHGFTNPFDPAMQWILVCAVRREFLEQLSHAIPAGVSLQALVPRAIAGIRAVPTNGSPDSTQLLVELTPETAALILTVQGRPLRCMLLDRDGESDRCNGNATIAPWIRQARQCYRSLLDGLPREAWPRHGLMRSSDIADASLTPDLAQALAMDLTACPPTDDASPDAVGGRCGGAVGVAQLVLEGDASQNINFARPHPLAQVPLMGRSRRAMALAIAAAIGLMLLWGLDLYRSSWLARQVEQLRAAEQKTGAIQQRLAVDSYLARNASPALPALDAILTAAPPSLTMSGFGLTSDGQLSFVGSVGNGPELDAFLHKLQESKALTNVKLRSGRSDQQRWSVEITALTTPGAGLLLVGTSMPPVAATPPAAPTASTAGPPGAATVPASMPLKRGGP